ncbi:hypothetical protein Leryth_019528 [Lithospermum erythrorhizon]|nr:hypothetical protein Leryth_019528 [Lithospermum erythrorhizon]
MLLPFNRKQAAGMSLVSGASSNIRRVHKEPISFSKLPTEEVSANVQVSRRNIGSGVRKGRATKSRSSMKKPLDTLSEASEMTMESHTDSIVSVPVKVSLSNSLAFAKLHDPSSSRLRSKAISKSHQLDMAGSDWQTNDGSWNSSNIYQSQKHPKGYVSQEMRARSGPLLIPKPDSNQDTESQQVDRRSRPQVTVTATPRRFSDIGVTPFKGFLSLKARDNVSSQKHEMDQEKTNKRFETSNQKEFIQFNGHITAQPPH